MKISVKNYSRMVILLTTAFCFMLSACTTWYYQHPATGYGVHSASGYAKKDDLEPEKGTMQNALIEYMFTQADKPMVLYFNTILDYMAGGHEAGFMTQDFYKRAENNEIPALKKELEKAGLPAETGEDYARIVARLISDGINKSLQENAYAAMGWGNVLSKDEDTGKTTLSMGAVDYYIQIFPSKNLVRFFYHDPYKIVGGNVQEFDVSGIDGFWDKDVNKIDIDTIKSNIKVVEDRPLF